MKIITRFVMNAALVVVDEESFDYRGPLALCTGAEEVAAVEGGAKGAGEAAAATGAEAAGTEALGAEALGASALGAEALGAGTDAAFLGAEAAPGAAGLGTAEIGAPAAAEGLAAVGAGPVDIAGGDVVGGAASMAGDTGLVPEGLEAAAVPTATNAQLDAAITGAEGGNRTIGAKLLEQITNNPLTAAALGLNATSAILANQRGKDAAAQLKGAAAPFSEAGKDLIAQYKSGKLNPGDEFNINQWEQQQIAAVSSQYGGNSTAARNAKAQIEAKAQAMREAARKGLLDEGLKAMGMGTPLLTAAVQQQTQQDQALASSSASALNSLMLLRAMESRAG